MVDDDSELLLAGAAHDDGLGDLRWVARHYDGKPAIGAFGYGLRKALRRCTRQITVDRPSFQRAIAAAPPGALFVLAPSHRSYFDFLLTSYLCLARPELGVPTPAIAAAEEFGGRHPGARAQHHRRAPARHRGHQLSPAHVSGRVGPRGSRRHRGLACRGDRAARRPRPRQRPAGTVAAAGRPRQLAAQPVDALVLRRCARGRRARDPRPHRAQRLVRAGAAGRT